jgi:hypothetical protein
MHLTQAPSGLPAERSFERHLAVEQTDASLEGSTALHGGKLILRFADGLYGEIKLRPERLTGALSRLREERYSMQLRIVDGVPTWPEREERVLVEPKHGIGGEEPPLAGGVLAILAGGWPARRTDSV